jgi:hypothetical protein
MLGLEAAPAPFLALRGGYRQGGPNSPSGFSLGLGLQWSWARLDYAYLRMGNLGFLQQFSLSLFLPEPHLKALSDTRRRRLRAQEGRDAAE